MILFPLFDCLTCRALCVNGAMGPEKAINLEWGPWFILSAQPSFGEPPSGKGPSEDRRRPRFSPERPCRGRGRTFAKVRPSRQRALTRADQDASVSSLRGSSFLQVTLPPSPSFLRALCPPSTCPVGAGKKERDATISNCRRCPKSALNGMAPVVFRHHSEEVA